ncbi:sunset domain-containing protein [Aestuariimicrobium sp. T2.26MG-19.2B]|uniref:sunset domain-containing protein n=1 Tax=Aestuariimicrobium sp. T2.26MG-19.2B TaxID=3040679 RepID=UPI0024778D98|nr:hypothetical protein [Aestuariimicrobium sp. T2.26MG-19.2B]CAI9399680.1 hypothetical protein AESSP_00240 [Aestuariimicrobium sp. T2.26MG-19.2B]
MSLKKKKNKIVIEVPTPTERAHDAIDAAVAFLAPYVHTAQELAAESAEKYGPVALTAAKSAAGHAAEAATKAKESLAPHADSVLKQVSPYTDQARSRVQEDLVPKLVALLHEAEKHPAVQEASKRGAAALAAAKGEASLAEVVHPKKKRKVGKTIAGLVAATALLAGAAVAVRQFLTSKDSGWTAHEPSAAYTPGARASEEEPVQTFSASDLTEDEAANTAFEDADAAFSPDSDVASEATAEAPSYGEGSYVGENPPEGFTIKGNERSMKFHLPDSGGYDRTIADVWFANEEAAEKAGFTRAQR